MASLPRFSEGESLDWGMWMAPSVGGLHALSSLSQAWQTTGRIWAINSCSGGGSLSLMLFFTENKCSLLTFQPLAVAD